MKCHFSAWIQRTVAGVAGGCFRVLGDDLGRLQAWRRVFGHRRRGNAPEAPPAAQKKPIPTEGGNGQRKAPPRWAGLVSMGDFQKFGEDDEGKNDHAEKNGHRFTPSKIETGFSLVSRSN